MLKQNRRGNWESGLLAAALALAGTFFLINKVHSLVQAGTLSVHMLTSASPVLLVLVGVGLLLAEHGALRDAGSRQQSGNRRERRSA